MTNTELLNKLKKYADDVADDYYEDEAHQVSRDILEYIEELEEEIKESERIDIMDKKLTIDTENEMCHIFLYKDEFDEDVWENYCEILGVSDDSFEIKVPVVKSLVKVMDN